MVTPTSPIPQLPALEFTALEDFADVAQYVHTPQQTTSVLSESNLHMYSFDSGPGFPRLPEPARCAKGRLGTPRYREGIQRSNSLTAPPSQLQETRRYRFATLTEQSLTDSASTCSDDEKSDDKVEVQTTPTPEPGTYDDKIATTETISELEAKHPMPAIRGSTLWNDIRYLCFTYYRLLMLLVLLTNLAIIASKIANLRNNPKSFTYRDAATATGANLLVAVLIRQEHVVNLLFHTACAIPYWTPLQIRCSAAKFAYNNGGIHAGAGHSALLWYIFYTVLLVRQFEGTPVAEKAISALTAVSLSLLVIIVITAHPSLRRKYHDLWELSHRYCGWAAVGLVWAQTMIITIADAHRMRQSAGKALVSNPTLWFLAIITCCLIYPWLWLRRLPVHANQLSSHATELHFHNRHVPICSATRLSHSPLVENHSFATISRRDGEKGYSVLVSNAGNWTQQMITQPPTHLWQRGLPTMGVMRLTSMFRPIVVVATGSGIGPCMSFFNAQPHHPVRILWSARFPEATYGTDVLSNVFAADKNAVVIDTRKTGQPNLAAIAYALVRERRAEAVMIISNPKVTREVVYAMQVRGVAAFGAIFDS